MSGTSRGIPRLLLECDLAWEMKAKRAKTLCSKLGLEVPDVILPDVGDQLSGVAASEVKQGCRPRWVALLAFKAEAQAMILLE